MRTHNIWRWVIASAVLASSNVFSMDYVFNGFMTVTGGTVVASEDHNPDYLDYGCPCLITDYNQAGLYENSRGFSLLPESRAGVQATAVVNDALSFTGQAVGRTVDHDVSLEWAYITYNFTDNWSASLGRKRLPIYFYSDFQDVGNAYIFVRPPQTLYGWEVSNFNGVTLRYQGLWDETEIDTSVFAGEEEVIHSEYVKIYDTYDQNTQWKNIRGINIEFKRDWLTSRLVFITTENYMTSNDITTGHADIYPSTPQKQQIAGFALNADFDTWFILSEFNRNYRKDFFKAPNNTFGMGYRWKKWTPFINYSRYWEESLVTGYDPERYIDVSFTLRYDINKKSDVKFQFDDLKDRSKSDFVGDTRVIAISYDRVF